MRVGVLGSAFNPPHIAHFAFAAEARWQLQLDAIWLVPTGSPPHKELEGDPGAATRLAMVRAAVGDREAFHVSDVEVDREGASYMSETLEHVVDELPGGTDLRLLLGADAAMSLENWKRPESVVASARLAVAMRAGIEPGQVASAVARLCPPERLDFINLPTLEVSSSMVRDRIRDGRPFDFYVPEGVGQMIRKQGLYGFGNE